MNPAPHGIERASSKGGESCSSGQNAPVGYASDLARKHQGVLVQALFRRVANLAFQDAVTPSTFADETMISVLGRFSLWRGHRRWPGCQQETRPFHVAGSAHGRSDLLVMRDAHGRGGRRVAVFYVYASWQVAIYDVSHVGAFHRRREASGFTCWRASRGVPTSNQKSGSYRAVFYHPETIALM